MKHLLKNITLICILLFCIISYTIAQDRQYGLGFYSFEAVQEERTGLDLTPYKPFSFSEGFSLSFDAYFTSSARANYGYVFRIIGRNNQHIDFLLNETVLVVSHSLGQTYFRFDEINFNDYLPFEIQLDISNSILNISVNGESVSIENIFLEDFKEVNIVFGKCNYPQLQLSDIPKMRIKDIRINNSKGDNVYYWPLSKYAQNGVYDELNKQFAYVENPKWILNNYVFWKSRVVSLNTQRNPQICYNSTENSISIFNDESVYIYDIKSQLLKEKNLNQGITSNHYTNQVIYNQYTDSTYYYFDLGDDLTPFDTLTNEWNASRQRRYRAFYSQHNKVIAPFDSCMYTFGGYGHHLYSNEFNKYDFKNRSWERLSFTGDLIHPRYLSGFGMIDESKVVIFGGYGSESGIQEISPRNYYDLYIADIKERTIKKIWELEPFDDNLVFANSVIVDTLNKCFYALCFPQQRYNTSLFLGKFSLEKPEYELFENNFPFGFEDIYSYVNLFLDKENEELVAVTSSPVVRDSSATVSIYTLAFPPLSEHNLYQDEKRNSTLKIVLIVSGCLLLCACVIYSRKKKKVLELPTDSTLKHSEKNRQPKDQTEKQAILLLGGFKVINRDGQNITSEFSPLLKQLFLIILLNTLKDGISSLKLKEILWFDKTPERARNNRGVLLSRLRQLFEQVGSVNIENRNSILVVELEDDIYCDYYEAITLMKWLRENTMDKEALEKLLNIVSKGEMLPDFQIDWIDPFKAEFSNSLIDLLLDLAKHPKLNLSNKEYIDLANAIFIHDSLNEDALKIKCIMLSKMGKNGLAKSAYDSFQKEYHTSLGIDFRYSFEQIIS